MHVSCPKYVQDMNRRGIEVSIQSVTHREIWPVPENHVVDAKFTFL